MTSRRYNWTMAAVTVLTVAGLFIVAWAQDH